GRRGHDGVVARPEPLEAIQIGGRELDGAEGAGAQPAAERAEAAEEDVVADHGMRPGLAIQPPWGSASLGRRTARRAPGRLVGEASSGRSASSCASESLSPWRARRSWNNASATGSAGAEAGALAGCARTAGAAASVSSVVAKWRRVRRIAKGYACAISSGAPSA